MLFGCVNKCCQIPFLVKKKESYDNAIQELEGGGYNGRNNRRNGGLAEAVDTDTDRPADEEKRNEESVEGMQNTLGGNILHRLFSGFKGVNNNSDSIYKTSSRHQRMQVIIHTTTPQSTRSEPYENNSYSSTISSRYPSDQQGGDNHEYSENSLSRQKLSHFKRQQLFHQPIHFGDRNSNNANRTDSFSDASLVHGSVNTSSGQTDYHQKIHHQRPQNTASTNGSTSSDITSSHQPSTSFTKVTTAAMNISSHEYPPPEDSRRGLEGIFYNPLKLTSDGYENLLSKSTNNTSLPISGNSYGSKKNHRHRQKHRSDLYQRESLCTTDLDGSDHADRSGDGDSGEDDVENEILGGLEMEEAVEIESEENVVKNVIDCDMTVVSI